MFIRKFDQTDYPVVKSIYQQGIDTGNATFQPSAKNWEEWNKSMLNHSRIVAVENDTILGWAALSPISSRLVYSGVAEVSVYVAASAQGKGIGQINNSIQSIDHSTQVNASITDKVRHIAVQSHNIANQLVETNEKIEFIGKEDVLSRKIDDDAFHEKEPENVHKLKQIEEDDEWKNF